MHYVRKSVEMQDHRRWRATGHPRTQERRRESLQIKRNRMIRLIKGIVKDRLTGDSQRRAFWVF